MALTLAEIADKVGAEFQGDPEKRLQGVASLQSARSGHVSLFTHTRYKQELQNTQAGVVVLKKEHSVLSPVACLIAENPHLVFARIATFLTSKVPPPAGINPDAVIDESANIDASASIAAKCVIGRNTQIGRNAVIGPACIIGHNCNIGDDFTCAANVTICDDVHIGDRTIIHPGVVIGSDGFGLANDDGVWIKVPQTGGVSIGNDVEIGANTTIDRGALDDTVIEDGVKLDNQIQVAHNVHIGAHTAIAGCAGIAGSTHIGRYCTLAGGVGLSGHVILADNVHITAMSLVTKSITEPGVYSSGTPLQENKKWHRNFVRFRQLDDMAKRLKKIEKKYED